MALTIKIPSNASFLRMLTLSVLAMLLLVNGSPSSFPSLVERVAAEDKPAKSKAKSVTIKPKADRPKAIPPAADKPTAEDPSVADKDAPVPLDLTKHLAMKGANFEKTTRYAWKIVPHGEQTHANVPLKIDGTIFLWGKRNTDNGQKYPEKVEGIAVQQTFETLYVYHGAFFEGKTGTPVYEIVFHYEDGTTATDKILNGEDLRDWYGNRKLMPFGPTGKRSVLAWDADFKSGDQEQPVRFCLTAVENPYPMLEVETIDLVSSKGQTAGCILAMTPGKSGLISRAEEPKVKDSLP